MKVLVIDRDDLSANLIKSRLEPVGHIVEVQAGKSEAIDTVSQQGWDVVFMDPSPLTNAKPIVMNIRRNVRRGVYMILTSESMAAEDAILSGFNDFIPKPLDPSVFDVRLENAARLNGLLRHLANDAEDYPSAGGVIAKSAFNQLFLSSMDRADRYGETAYIIFITFSNYTSVVASDGEYEADVVAAKLAQTLVRLRRQSDIIAQVRKNEYALILMRPMGEAEPYEAAARFAEALSKCVDLPTNPIMDVEITVTLMKLPMGSQEAHYTMSLRQA
jgi:CheY-like chemotaxis protein